MRAIVFATNNAHKLEEVQKALPSIEVKSLKAVNFEGEIPEDHETLEENSAQKADFITEHTGLDCFADDTGLEVEALNGAPGVYSARYAGEHGNSEANMEKLLSELEGNSNRNAQFRTVVTLNLDGKQHQFEGICKGTITTEKQGDKGFGYDPIFIPEGYSKTFAELDMSVKNAISHRGLAVQKLVDFLNKQA